MGKDLVHNGGGPRGERAPPSFSLYVEHLRRRNAEARTIETYSDCLGVYGEWLDDQGIEPLVAMPADLERFRLWLANDRRVGLSRQSTYVAMLRGLYEFLFRERKVFSDPAKGMRYPKVPKRIHRDILTPRELKRLFGRPDESEGGMRDRAAIRLLAVTGLRASELSGVDVGDVSLKDRELIVRKPKGKKQRLAFFDRDTQAMLAKYLSHSRPRLARSDEQALIVNRAGERMDRHELYAAVVKHAKGARINRRIAPHSLRRTFCTLMLKAGANLKVIADLAGHKRLRTTAGYTRLDVSELKDVYDRTHPLGGGA